MLDVLYLVRFCKRDIHSEKYLVVPSANVASFVKQEEIFFKIEKKHKIECHTNNMSVIHTY